MSSPLVDWGRKIGSWASKEDQPEKKVDSSWHAKAVEEANESFRKLADRKPLGTQKAPVKKKTTKKQTARKQG